MHLVAQPHNGVGAKQENTRHWLAAGAVLASAAMIAAAPGISPIPAGAQHDIQADAVRLTAGWDPFAPWQAAFDTAKADGKVLADNFLLAPGVGLQQAIVNQLGYAKQLFEDPSSFEAVSQQFAANVMKLATGLTLIGADDATREAVLKHTLGGMHGMAIDMFPGFLAEGVDPELFSGVMNVLSSPLSGVLIGSVSPVISPAVALLNSAVAISNALQAGDSTTALSSLLGVPAGMVDAFLNGATLNLDALAPMINDAGLIKDTVTIAGLNIAFGGLLTPGSTDRSTYEYTDEDGNKVTIPSVGGSIFNSIGMDIKLGALPISVKGEAVGPIGALQGLSQTVGVLLGSGWDDWDGKGNAPAPKPPLFGLQPAALGDIFSDTAESAAVTKLRDLLRTATVDDIVKKLQGVDTETVADEAAAAAPVVESPVSDEAAAATELTHATANKLVSVAVPKPEAPAEAADTTPTADEETAAPAESAGEAESTGTTTAQKVKTRPKAALPKSGTSAQDTKRNLVKGIKDAVKNARGGSTGHTSRSANESGSSSTGSSAGTSSKASGSQGGGADSSKDSSAKKANDKE
ncbi:outer membrane porin GjpA [Mycolicibacterium sp. HK-90]|uniref:outer membrane porin GjpA n=1 Tax=Mycolicibacterium sp. HK-90 TaxID=3056937 RepID=UPI0026598C41|nr:outer membrane porin GjpA [Mycolicibacterium sp. HK-90]WKG05214.1 outer membrane porin GjpA [Mycolicibacterium sp. HK-90]